MTAKEAYSKANEANKDLIDLELNLIFKQIEIASTKGEYKTTIPLNTCEGTISKLEEFGYRVFRLNDVLTAYWERDISKLKKRWE